MFKIAGIAKGVIIFMNARWCRIKPHCNSTVLIISETNATKG